MDPAALGTLRIGLDAERLDQHSQPRRLRAVPSTRRSVRATTATALRTLADRLERPTTQAAPG